MTELPNEVEEEEEPEKEVELETDEVEFDWEELLGDHNDYEFPLSRGNEKETREIPLISQESFSEQIIKQLQDCNVNKRDLKIAEEVLGNLDEQGYLTIEPMLISDRLQLEEQDILDVMFKIQRLDPPGLAARNMQECLLAQAEVRNENPTAVMILQD